MWNSRLFPRQDLYRNRLAALACATVAAGTAALLPATSARAAWPDKPITIIVPFPAGGGTDVVMRSVQPLLAKALNQTIIVENRAGAGGTIGSGQVARAQPDGYTAVLATTSTHAVSVSVYSNLAYDPRKDFAYAGFIGVSPYVLAVAPKLQADTSRPLDLKTLTARMKQGTTPYNLASVGVGTVSHLLGEQFGRDAGVQLTHVPYRGAAPAYTDLIGGQVDLMFDNPIAMAAYAKAGKIIPVATTASTALLPDVPTFAQQGMQGYTQTLWYGLAFPKNTPAAVVQRFNAELNKVLTDPDLVADLSRKGIDAKPGTPDAMAKAVDLDVAYWGRIASAVGARID